MPIRAQNGLPVSAAWSAPIDWPYGGDGATKLDAFVNGTDVVVQVLEEFAGFAENQSLEILLRQGFNSREFPTPFVRWRFKVWTGTILGAAGTVDYTVFS